MVKKKNRKVIGIVGVILALALLFFATSGQFFSVMGQGMTITSISNVGVLTPDSDLSGKWFLINAVSNGGQSIVATINPSQTQSLGLGYETEYPMTVEMEASEEKVKYLIKNTGTNIYSYESLIQSSPDGCSDIWYWVGEDAPSCPSDYTWKIDVHGTDVSWDAKYVCKRVCVKKVQEGVSSIIEPASVKKKIKMVLTASGERLEQEVEVGRSANFYSNILRDTIATIQVPALFWTGNYPASGQGYKGYHQIDSGKWSITTDERLNNYIGVSPSLDLYLTNLQDKNRFIYTDFSENSFNYEIGKVNKIVTSMQNDNAQIGGSLTNIEKINGQTYATVDSDATLARANIVIRMRADWVGIKIPFGKPKIISSSCPDFKSGENGEIILQVQNTGTSTGNFIPSVSCEEVEQSYNLGSVSISAKQIKEIIIPIDTGLFAGERLDTCKIRVEDYNNPDNYDESSATCQLLKPALCIENDIYTSNNCISQCIGGVKEELHCCENNEKLSYDESLIGNEYDGFYCNTEDDDGGDDNKCKSCWGWLRNEIEPGYCSESLLDKYLLKPIGCIIYFFKLAVLVILSLVGLFIIQGNLIKIDAIKRKPIISWIISFLIISIFAFIGYLFLTSILFYFIIIGLIIFQVITSFIPGAKLIKRGLRRK